MSDELSLSRLKEILESIQLTSQRAVPHLSSLLGESWPSDTVANWHAKNKGHIAIAVGAAMEVCDCLTNAADLCGPLGYVGDANRCRRNAESLSRCAQAATTLLAKLCDTPNAVDFGSELNNVWGSLYLETCSAEDCANRLLQSQVFANHFDFRTHGAVNANGASVTKCNPSKASSTTGVYCNSKINDEKSVIEELITLTQMQLNCCEMVDMQTVRNVQTRDKDCPRPIVPASGRRPARFDFQQLRSWFIEKWTETDRFIPNSFSEAKSLLDRCVQPVD